MSILYIIIIICVFFQAERGILGTVSFLRLFKQMEDNLSVKSVQTQKRLLYILIPVLNEQPIIEDTILNLLKIKQQYFEVQIVIAATIRESQEVNETRTATTEEIIKGSLLNGNLSEFKKSIHIFQDPDQKGNMATQLNYALGKLGALANPSTLYILYNADSAISETTFIKLSELVEKHSGLEFAFQQPCAFVKEMRITSSQFLNALSLYQTWYCLGVESRLLYKYGLKSIMKLGGIANKRLGVIVGHGSGMTLGLNAGNGRYPADLLTEDLTFGFVLSANSVPILLLPALEIADVPSKFSSFIHQKSVWFWNYIGYIDCYKKMRENGSPNSQLIPLLFQGVGAGLYWLFSAFFILAPIVLSLIIRSYWIAAVSFVCAFIFCIIPQYILLRKMPHILQQQRFFKTAEDVKKISFAQIFLPLCLIIITDSVGPWIALFKSIRYFSTGKLPMKYKTSD